MTEWEVARIVETGLNAYGFDCELETGGGGTPEIFIPFQIDLGTHQMPARLHYATFVYEGLAVETDPLLKSDYEEGPAYPRLEIDRDKPIGRQVREYLDELKPLLPFIECPSHRGSFDCTPFCDVCHGNQETLAK